MAFLLNKTSLSALLLKSQKAEDSLTLSRRRFLVEPGAREKTCLRPISPLVRNFDAVAVQSKKPAIICKFSDRSCSLRPEDAQKLVTKVKEKLNKEHNNLPVGKNGRDDEEMILWYLKDRKFSVEDAVSKLTKAIRWRHEFGVSELSEESVKNIAKTGKACVHNYLDVYGRPTLIVDASKHFPGEHAPSEDEKLCVFMIERALSRLPAGKQDLLVIVDLRGFRTQNADLRFFTFVFDAFYYYYPRRLGEVLCVDAPFIFKPFWHIIKPLLKSYASLVKFCSAADVKEKYFTVDTVPANYRD